MYYDSELLNAENLNIKITNRKGTKEFSELSKCDIDKRDANILWSV